MTAQTLPPKIEAALALLETSTDVARGEVAFWTVRRFYNGFGYEFALQFTALNLVSVLLSIVFRNPAGGPWVWAAALPACFILANRKRATAILGARVRMVKGLRRWRALASTSLSEKGVA